MTHRALCWLCFRGERGFGFTPNMKGERGKARFFCGRGHQLMNERKKLMTDWTEAEEEHIWAGIKTGGEYLKEIGEYDLAKLTREQLIAFQKCVLKTVVEERFRGVDDLNDEIPF